MLQKNSTPASWQPLVFVSLLIILIIGFFVLKSITANRKNNIANTETPTNKEMPAVALFAIDNIRKAVNNPTYQMVDIRETALFDQTHIESSINIPLENANQDLSAFEKSKKIIIIDAQDSYQGKVFTQKLAELMPSVQYLEGGLEQYTASGYPVISTPNPTLVQDRAKVISISAEDFKSTYAFSRFLVILDVRNQSKAANKPIPSAIAIPLEELEKRKSEIPRGTIIVVDENPMRSFQATAKLFDMNIIGVYHYNASLDSLLDALSTASEPENKAQEK